MIWLDFGCLAGDEGAGFVGGVGGVEELVDGLEVDGHGVDDSADCGPDSVLVAGKFGESVDVFPYALV